MANSLPTSSIGAGQENGVASRLEGGLGHLAEEQRSSLLSVLDQYPSVCRDSPGRTTKVVHDIDGGDAAPIKQSPYRVHPRQVPIIQGEIDAMLRMGLIRKGKSE